MRAFLFPIAAALLVGAPSLPAAVIGLNPPAESLTAERIAALPAAERAPWLGYLARSEREMRADQAFVRAEMKASGPAQPILPPKGSSADSIPLHRPAAWYGGPEAARIADIIVSFQTPNGGWSKNIDMTRAPRRPGESFMGNELSKFPVPDDYDAPHRADWNYFSTLDNDATTTQLRFLAKAISASGPDRGARWKAAFFHGLGYLLASQYPNGGWPQVWPLEGGYHDAITYNDDAMTQAMEVLRDSAQGRGDYGFVPAEWRSRAAAAVDRGLRCVLATQISAGGRLAVWCQQHDPLTLRPESARNYEMPADASGESARILLFLLDDPRPTPEVDAAIRAAGAWFERTKIYGWTWRKGPDGRNLFSDPGAGPIWARYYEIGTDRPIFGDRDKTIHDKVGEISRERRNGYRWYADVPLEALERYRAWKQKP